MAVQSAEHRDQILHWLAEQLPFARIETLCVEHGWEKPERKELWHLMEHHRKEVLDIRETWQALMWKEGLANKEVRLAKELALAETLIDLSLDPALMDFSGKPKYAARDMINLMELIGRETGQIGEGTGKDDNRFQVLAQNIYFGVLEKHAAIEVGAEGRLFSPVEIPANVGAGGESPLLNVAPVPVVRRRRQRKVVPDGEGGGATRLVPAGDSGREDS